MAETKQYGSLGSTVDVSEIADGTDGELITWDSSGVAATVAVGTNDQVLTSNGAGAAPTFQAGSAGGISNVVEDLTPQLGGDLDLNGKNIDFPTTANISDCLDEDAMGTNSATMLATQQSIKAYVDSGTVTFTNKTINTASNTITVVTADVSDFAASTITFTNKTFDANATGNSLSNVDVADLANGTDGQLITWAADATAATVATGTSTHVLTSNGAGAAPTFQAAAASGISNVVEDTTPQLGGQLDVNGNAIGSGTNELITFVEAGSAVNHIIVASASTNNPPHISAGGDDTNVNLRLTGKGTGLVYMADSDDVSKILSMDMSGVSATTTTALKPSSTANRTITLPNATDTLVGKATTDTFTNKTFDANASGNSLSNVDLTADVINDLPVTEGGTGVSTLTDGGVLLGSGTSAVTAMAVLADSEMIVGDGTTDPVAESGATLRTSIGVAIGSDVQAFDANNATASSTTTFTNKTYDANATGNALSNVDVADLANGTDGELITWSASAVPATVAVGTAGHYLKSGGTGVAPTFAQGGGQWEFVSSTTLSDDADVSFTALTGPAHKMVICNLVPATNATDLYMTVSNDGGVGYASADYSFGSWGMRGATVIDNGSSTSAQFDITADEIGTATGEHGLSGEIIINSMNDAARPCATSWEVSYHEDTGGIACTRAGGGMSTDNGNTGETLDIDSFKLAMSSGNLTSGTILLYKLVTA